MLFVYPRRSLAIPNAIILRGTLSLIFQLPCGTRTRRFSSALVRGPVGAGFPPVRSSDRLIRSAQGPHQQACRFVAYLIHIARWRDQRAMTEAKEARHHDLDIGLQLTCRCVGSGEPGQTADATAIAVDKGGQSLCDERVATRSEEHTSELQSLMRISYAVFCLKKKQNPSTYDITKSHSITKQTDRYTT